MNPQDVHVDAVLTNLAIEYATPGFVADKIFPFVDVKHESDKFYTFTKREELSSEAAQAKRAPGDKAHEIKWEGATDLYSCEEYALRNLLPDRIRDNSDAPVRPRARIARKITKKLWLGFEERVQALTQDIANIPNAAVANKWDAAAGDPELDVDAGKESMRMNVGNKPTHMVLSGPAARALRRKLKSKTTGLRLQEEIEFSELPARVFGLTTIVAESLKNTANMGQALAVADVWDDNVVLAYVDPDPGLESFTFGLTFRKQDLVLKTWRDEERKGEWQEGSWLLAEKRVVKDAAFIIKDVLT